MSFGRYNNDNFSSSGLDGSSYGGGYGANHGYGGGGYGGGFDKQSGLGSHLHSIDWGHQQLAKFEKNFYHEDRRVSERSEREVLKFRDEKEIKVRSRDSRTSVLRALSYRNINAIGFRSWCSQARFHIRGGWVSCISDVHDPCAKVPFAHANPMPGLAHGSQWSRYGWYCTDRKWQDDSFCSSSYHAY